MRKNAYLRIVKQMKKAMTKKNDKTNYKDMNVYEKAAQLLETFGNAMYSGINDGTTKIMDNDWESNGALPQYRNYFEVSFICWEKDLTKTFRPVIDDFLRMKMKSEKSNSGAYRLRLRDDNKKILLTFDKMVEDEVGYIDVWICKDLLRHERFGKIFQSLTDRLVTFPVRRVYSGNFTKGSNEEVMHRLVEWIGEEWCKKNC